MSDGYVAGLLDGDGAVGFNVQEGYEGSSIVIRPRVRIFLKDEYFAGLFDSEGTVNASPYPHKNHIWVKPVLKIELESSYELLTAIKERYGGNVRPVATRSNMIEWCVSSLDEAVYIVDVLLSYCIIKRPQLLIMQEVLSLMKTGEHLSPEGLFYILKQVEELKRLNNKPTIKNRDWTKVFESVFGIAEYIRVKSLYEESKNGE